MSKIFTCMGFGVYSSKYLCAAKIGLGRFLRMYTLAMTKTLWY